MKKLLLAAALCSANFGFAQSVDTYIFKTETGKAYTPLTAGTNITSSLIWDEENFKIPMGFTADIGGKTTSFFSLGTSGVFGIASDTAGVINTFIPFGADLTDRSFTSTPLSPIRYEVSGATPNRIFKLELSNAGFYEEYSMYSTLNDSVNFQVWVYETKNIVELRYGTAQISHAADYFGGAAPVVGYAKNIDYDLGSYDKIYVLTGSSSAPTIDSFFGTTAPTTTILSSYPASGTVYRFVPKTIAASIGESTIASGFKVYPTMAVDEVYVENKTQVVSTATIYNSLGQIVLSDLKINAGKSNINVSNLASGSYLLEVKNNDGKATYKFSK